MPASDNSVNSGAGGNEAATSAQAPCPTALMTVLDSLDALVYVSDLSTHELLFLNAYGRARWGDPDGRKCWEVLQQGQQASCAFCSNSRLLRPDGKPAGVIVWEFQNTANGRWYQCRDQAVEWTNGRLVRIEIATDITDRKAMEEELRIAKQQAEALARTDELTGLYNRRAFFELGEQALKQAGRRREPLAVVMFDIDYFKQINDSHGHMVGDQVLRQVAAVAASVCRETDVLGRLGGEEFAVVLPASDYHQALVFCERLRSAIAAVRMADVEQPVTCTASFGVVAQSTNARTTLEHLLSKADQALFLAKHKGRNRVEYALLDDPF